MTLYQAEYRSKIRRERTKEAVALAMESRWQEAVDVNRAIIDLFPDDVESYNRLGKAYLELGSYDDALRAFTRALQLSPSNSIARKNLDRIDVLRKAQQQPKRVHTAKPLHFLEESGKTGSAVLEQTAGKESIAKLTAGESVNLVAAGRRLLVESADGERIGLIPPRLAGRLLRLMQGGNQYQAVITRLQGGEITVLIRETYQHPSQRGISSFPSKTGQLRPYPPVPIRDFEPMEDEDEEIQVAFSAEWDENDEGVSEASPRPIRIGESPSEDDEEEI